MRGGRRFRGVRLLTQSNQGAYNYNKHNTIVSAIDIPTEVPIDFVNLKVVSKINGCESTVRRT